MEKDGLVFPQIIEYMRKMRRERTGRLSELEKASREAKLPVSEPETADLLEILCHLRRPCRILEIGTCVGFSALLMHEACPDAEIITIERNPVMLDAARENFKLFGAETQITLLDGDAADILPTIPGKTDLIFLDAAKGQYASFFPDCMRLLSDSGILIADNVLFNGMVATGEANIRRNKTIVSRLSDFLSLIEAENTLKTVILPISDGVTVSLKMQTERSE